RLRAQPEATGSLPPTIRTIEITGALNTTGGYNLALDNCDVVAVSFGSVIASGLLDTDCIAINPLSGDLSYGFYAYFDATAGQEVSVSMSSGDFDATVFLFGPNGDLIAADDAMGTDATIAITLPATGTYIVFPASFEDLSLGAFDLVVNQTNPGIPASLAFSIGPSNRMIGEVIPIEVTVLDALGNRVIDATTPVTLEFAVNPGRLLLRASGEGGDVPRLQPLEPKAPAVYPDLSGTQANEIWGMSYDPTLDAVIAVDWSQDLTAIDPVTGTQTFIGSLTACCIRALGRAMDGRLIGGGSPSDLDDQIYEVDPLTADAKLIGAGSVPISGDPIRGFHGLATDPTDGTLWGLVSLLSTPSAPMTRYLVTIDLSASPSPTATMVATVSKQGTADIAFFPDGTMYAITGNGATNPETLWKLDKATGMMTLVFVLGDGMTGSGESIAAIPAQLIGPLTVLPGSGVAVFNGVAINAPATGYRLTATSPGLTSAVSVIFDIN
ncbi:MAG: PPC domain-containing protein, partial [Gemmatimonadetes bacterium]|nr:PPC domain-containing protein [Gemmatimonadota bacterium]